MIKITDIREKNIRPNMLEKKEDNFFQLEEQDNDSPSSYHLFLLSELEKAVDSGKIEKYHFNFIRNILEKTAIFLGYGKWEDLIPKKKDGTTEFYKKKILNIYSHSDHAGEEGKGLSNDDKETLGDLVRGIRKNYQNWQWDSDD